LAYPNRRIGSKEIDWAFDRERSNRPPRREQELQTFIKGNLYISGWILFHIVYRDIARHRTAARWFETGCNPARRADDHKRTQCQDSPSPLGFQLAEFGSICYLGPCRAQEQLFESHLINDPESVERGTFACDHMGNARNIYFPALRSHRIQGYQEEGIVPTPLRQYPRHDQIDTQGLSGFPEMRIVRNIVDTLRVIEFEFHTRFELYRVLFQEESLRESEDFR
jgi:hypothetical protein